MYKEAIFQLKSVPKKWLIPKKEQAVLAVIAAIFWGVTLWQALTVHTKGASVFSLFGLGLLYLIFSIANLSGALVKAIAELQGDTSKQRQAEALVQLFIVMVAMFALNAAVLIIYAAKGTTITSLDTISFIIDTLLVLVLIAIYGRAQSFTHPIARGWLAIAGKTVPQLVMAWLFFTQPSLTHGLALLTLLGINALSFLRFLPAFKAFRRNRKDIHLKGLLIGETGNVASGLLLTIAWIMPHIV